jgi:hypothetical protein
MTQKKGLRRYLSLSHDDQKKGTEETTKNKRDNSSRKTNSHKTL